MAVASRRKKKTSSRQKKAKASRETFGFMSKNYVFDVTKAIKIVQDGRESVELDDDDVRFSLQKVSINHDHLKQVDVSRPGIIAIVHAFDHEGRVVKGHRLIDGHHRASRCLELDIPFHAYLLSEQESIEILERSPCRSLIKAGRHTVR